MSLRVVRALFLATLTVGTLDALDAIIFFGIRSGAKPGRIFQGIASTIIGPDSFNGGTPTLLLGVLFHYTVAFCIASTFFLVATRLPSITRRPFIVGPLFGVVAYWVMNLVVIPLTGSKYHMPATPVLINGLLIHMIGVGTPTALFARSAFRPVG